MLKSKDDLWGGFQMREMLLILLAGILVAGRAQGGEKLERTEGKKVLMIIASSNFHDETK